MLDSPVLLRLLRSAGLVLSASLIASVIESDQVARLREGLGEEDYAFALTKGARLRPASSHVSLTLASGQRTSMGASMGARMELGDAAFHTVLGLRLLMRQAEGLVFRAALATLGVEVSARHRGLVAAQLRAGNARSNPLGRRNGGGATRIDYYLRACNLRG